MLGFVCTRRVHVPCPGQRHGANGHLRVDYESVIQLRDASVIHAPPVALLPADL